MPTTPRTPECDKLAAAGHQRTQLIEFIEWLQNNWRLRQEEDRTDVLDLHDEITVLDFLGIDRDKLEEERTALLEYQRELNEVT